MLNEITVLAVDDDSINLEMLELMLSDRDCTVLKAGDGMQALNMLEANPHIDVVLLDLEMPVMDGYETIKRIRQNQSWSEIPVIVVTVGTNEVTRILSLGANDFISKPYNSEELRLRVMNLVRSKKLSDLARDMNASLELRVIERTEELRLQAIKLEQEIAERQMVQERLQVQATQLEKLNKTLELRVQERTTELSKRNAEILRAYDDLKMLQGQLLHQDKMASIGNLAAGMAHEINNPMGYIISNLASLSKYVDKLTAYLDANEQHFPNTEPGAWEYLVQERKKYKIDRIRQDLPELISESSEGVERIRKIVRDLKIFSRTDNSSDDFSDINEGLESTLTIAWNDLKYKATVSREYGQLPQVWCNMGQLNQVFINILINAAHAIEEKGEIRIATWAEEKSVRIAISDSGVGIAPENIKRIFDPFFTTKEVGKGTGLGLAIAYDIIVNKHGGIIDVTSEIGAGTTFTITLPVHRANTDDC